MQRSRLKRRTVVAVVAVVAIAVAFAIGLSEGGSTVEEPATVPSAAEAARAVASAPAPLRRLYANGGTLLDLDAMQFRQTLNRLRGYPVVINKWAEWCGPCRKEFPILRTAAARHGTRVAFLGLLSDDGRRRGEAFLREQPTVYPSVYDPKGEFARVLEATSTYPSTVFLDRDGKIVTVHQGVYRTLADFERDLRRYAGLDGRAVPDASGIEAPGAAR